MKRTIIAFAIAALAHAGHAQAGGGSAAELAALDGVWASPAAEPWYGGFGTREFAFAGGRWELTFTHALDPEMKMKTFVFRTGGPYTVGAASASVQGAHEAVFGEEWKKLTSFIEDAGMAKAFGFAPCGLVAGVEKDISAEGCANWKPVAQCGEDHDLLAMKDGKLYFGVRPADNDMCTPDKRPTALLGPVVAR